MPKRFTDTDKWKKPFIRNLEAPYKLLWFYIVDDCDVAGIWQTDFEVASLRIGEKIDENLAKEIFSEKVVLLDNGEKWFLPSFIEFQYGKLQDNNRAHSKAILTLQKYGLIDEFLNVKPLKSPLKGAMVEVKEKEEEEVKEKYKEKEEEEKEPEKVLIYPFPSDEFLNMWGNWKEYKSKEFKFKYKSIQSEQASLTELSNLSNCNEEMAMMIIKQSMANGWKGLFELKKENNGTTKHGQQSTSNKEEGMRRNFELADKVFAHREQGRKNSGGGGGQQFDG